jgi:RpiB/LacA/LacB family sugar-phosphate isomerase
MKIYLGSDHRGFMLKEKVFAYLVKNGYDVQDVGGVELNPDDDFPQFAQAAALKVIGDDSEDPRAILICGGGQGMCMAANRFKGIRASVIWDAQEIYGHNYSAIIQAIDKAKNSRQPSVIIAHTIPGRGVDFMEYDYRWHGKSPNAEEAERALAQLSEGGGE